VECLKEKEILDGLSLSLLDTESLPAIVNKNKEPISSLHLKKLWHLLKAEQNQM
jgi:hypothetical protein